MLTAVASAEAVGVEEHVEHEDVASFDGRTGSMMAIRRSYKVGLYGEGLK